MEHAGGVINEKLFKDTIKQNLTSCIINIDNFKDIVKDRPEWRSTISEGCKCFEDNRLEKLIEKRPSVIPSLQLETAHSCVTSVHSLAPHR